MKNTLLLLAILIMFSGCTKDIESYLDPRSRKPVVENPDNPSDSDDTSDPDDTDPDNPSDPDDKEPPIATVPPPPYQIPHVKTSSDFPNKIYIDPDYRGTDSNGSIQRPYRSINHFRNGVPPNTAFLVKRGTTHEKVGRQFGGNHTRYTSMIYKNNFIGPYGTGPRPVIEGFWIMGGSDGLTIRDIHIYAESQWSPGQDAIVYMHNSAYSPTATPAARCNNITIAYCILEGKLNKSNYFNPTPYPQMGIKFESNNFTLYHSIIKNIWTDGIYASGGFNHKCVRNWIYDVNHMAQRAIDENWPNSSSPDPASNDIGGGGDNWQARGSSQNYYLAGNVFDRSKTMWKFNIVFNTGWASNNRGLVIEHNTFYHPKSGLGGSSHYYNVPPETITRYNLYNATTYDTQYGTNAFAGGSADILQRHLTQSAPYGPRNNHIIRSRPGANVTWPNKDSYLHSSNIVFNTYADYSKFLQTNDPVGSDIDTKDFWRGYNYNTNN